MICADIVNSTRCGPKAQGTDNKDECQAYGCCWDDKARHCFKSTFRPVVIMHGMGSRLVEYNKNIRWLREAFPGIYVKDLNIYPGPPSRKYAIIIAFSL